LAAGTEKIQRRRREIFVEVRINNSEAPSGAASSEYVAPTGLEVNSVLLLQICRADGAPKVLAAQYLGLR
jgi:hypothetical protein